MRRRVALVGSSGGHLAHLLALRPWWEHHDRFWVTFNTRDAIEALGAERTYWCYHPTNRNPWNLIRNSLLALRLLVPGTDPTVDARCFEQTPDLREARRPTHP